MGYNDDKINKLLLNNVLHEWENQAYLQGFGSKEQTNHIEINLFEIMIITKQIYAGVMYNTSKKHGKYADCTRKIKRDNGTPRHPIPRRAALKSAINLMNITRQVS